LEAEADGYRRSWRSVEFLGDCFWKKWIKEYLPLLQHCQKWLQPIRNLHVGDVALMYETNSKRGVWPKGLVADTFPDKKGVYTANSSLLRDV